MTWDDHCVRVLGPDAPERDWLLARKMGVGASDTSGIMGVNPKSSPLQVWADKLSLVPDFEGNEHTARGKFWEPWLARWFETEHHVDLYEIGLLKSKQWPWMMATPDRLIRGRDELVEIKTTMDFPGLRAQWSDNQVSDHAETQVQHQLAVTGFQTGWVIVLVGCNPPFVRKVQRDDTHIAKIVAQTEKFWTDYVSTGREPQALPQDTAIIDQLHAGTLPEAVELPVEAVGWIHEYHQAHTQEKEARKRKEEAQNVLRQMLGDADHGIIDNRELLRVKPRNHTSFSSTKLAKDHPDIYAQYVNRTTKLSLTVLDI